MNTENNAWKQIVSGTNENDGAVHVINNIAKWTSVQDSDGHWYRIPLFMKDDFDALEEGAEDLFIERFSQYRTNGAHENA